MTQNSSRRTFGSRAVAVTIVTLLLLAVGCGAGRQKVSQRKSPSPGQANLGIHRPTELISAATSILRFLEGDGDFNQIRLADKVTLYLSPEGGGTSRKLDRQALRHPSNWAVQSEAFRHVYKFAPPQPDWELTTRVGAHLNCGYHHLLSTRFENLGSLPHVGTTLSPKDADSCLQSWNLTFVFDPKLKPPTLVAAVYDQWEW